MLAELVKGGVVTLEAAEERSSNPEDLRRLVRSA
jgi:hypothetical protein